MRPRVPLAIMALACTLYASPSHAFGVKTHVASVNQTLNQLSEAITNDEAPNVLLFEVNGRILNVQVTNKEAYRAILNQAEFYRAGAVGPDFFFDPISGQMWAHGNQSELLRTIVKEVTGTEPTDHLTTAPLDDRLGLSELRSGDFVSALLRFFQSEYVFDNATEREQILAFIIGYMSHGVGDGFSHTWVNDLAGGAWDVQEGSGIFGSATEELQHIAVERFLNTLVPDDLINVPGDSSQQLIDFQAPDRFLDEFFSSFVSPTIAMGPDPNNSPIDYAKHFAQVDMYYGGPIANVFNAQLGFADAVTSWSQLAPVFDFSEQYQETQFIGAILDAADYPAQLLSDFANAVPPVPDPFSVVTGGVVDCYDPIEFGAGSTDLEKLRSAWAWLGGINERLDTYKEKARVARRNWINLSECTGQNIAKLDCSELDPADPTADTDACLETALLPWQDLGEPKGLYRGNLRPTNMDIELFLGDIQDAFQGNSSGEPIDAFEARGDHYSFPKNVERMLKYLVTDGFVLDEFIEVLFPGVDELSSPDLRGRYNAFCSQVRDQAYENCLDLKLAPIAATAREVQCKADFAVCLADAQEGCLKESCNLACGFPLPCGSICGDPADSGVCGDVCAFFFPCAFGICLPGRGPCDSFCGLLTGENDTCLETAVESGTCGVEDVVCSIENLTDTVLLENYGEEILEPARDACDQVDQALLLIDQCTASPDAFEDCLCDFVGPVQCAEIRRVRERADQILNIARTVGDEVCSRPAHSLVNFTFLWEDMVRDPLYLDSIDAALPGKFAEVSALPPGDERTEKLQTLVDFQDLVNDAKAAQEGNPIPLLMDPDDPRTVVRDAYDLDLIPDFAGPTAQDIIVDVGTDMRETFDPFFNTVQGMKLAPLVGPEDMEALFAQEGVSSALLPSLAPALYSTHCSAPIATPFCDVISSFDDPNCDNCDASELTGAGSPQDWVPGRGLVAWNPYDPTGSTPRNVLTNFPLASTQEAYDSLYTRVFRVPDAVPGFVGFDDPNSPWEVTQGGATLTHNTDEKTEGSASLQIDGCNFVEISSPSFKTADFGVFSNQLSIDVYIPENADPDYVGDVALLISVRGAEMNHEWADQVELTPLNRGAWNEITFNISDRHFTALAADFANASFHLTFNFGSCDAPFLVDNMRFVGDVQEREVFHGRRSAAYTVVTNSFMSFDQVADWSGDSSLVQDRQTFIQGSGAVAFIPGWWTLITSRSFSTTELASVTNRLNLDVYLPANPPVPDLWQSNIQMFLTCGPHNNLNLGPVGVRHGFLNEYNSYEFGLPPEVVQTFQQSHSGCQISVALSMGNPEGAQFRMDNMGFIQP